MTVSAEELAIFSINRGTIVLGGNKIKIVGKSPHGSLLLRDIKGKLLQNAFGKDTYTAKPGPLINKLGDFTDLHVKYNKNWDSTLTRATEIINKSPAKVTKSPAKAAKSPAKVTKSPAKVTKSPAKAAKSPAKAANNEKICINLELSEGDLRHLCDGVHIRHTHIKKSSTLAKKLCTHYSTN